MSAFDDSFDRLLGVEGHYTNDPHDTGGATMWGITERTARAHGFTGDMHDLPRETAKVIYKKEYWDPLQLDAVSAMSAEVAYELFDTNVNLPWGYAITFLQRALNALNDGGNRYSDLKVDGRMGPLTLDALRTYLGQRPDAGEKVLLRALNSQQGSYYINLSIARPQDERFVYGWFLKRVS